MIRNFLKLEKNLRPEQKMIIESSKAFANQYLKPRIINDYKNEVVDKNIFKEMGDMGLLGPTIKGYNCLGESYLTYGLIAKEIEAVDSGYRSMFSVQSSLVMNPINKFGTEKQKNKYLPELASGRFVGCFGLTEPDHGSNPAGMITNAVKDGDNYILNGSKTWISNSPIADLFLVWAKDKSHDNKIKGFLIEKNTPGLTAPKIEGKLSLRASVTGMIMLDDVKIPKENVLQVEGLKGPFTCLNDARLGISFGTLGAAESCIEQVIDYTTQRKQFDQFLAEKQLIQFKIANMITEYNLALSACYQVAQLKDQEEALPEMISMIKRNSCQKSLDIARISRDILGGNGISEEYNVFRHLTNLETVNTYEGTADIHALILGKFFTGYSSF
jgi:glutaryl-CoA dehydrogenase